MVLKKSEKCCANLRKIRLEWSANGLSLGNQWLSHAFRFARRDAVISHHSTASQHRSRSMVCNVADGSWLCKNASAEALTPGVPGAPAMLGASAIFNGRIGDELNQDQIRLKKGRAVHKRGLGHFLDRAPGDGGKPKSNCASNARSASKFPLWYPNLDNTG